MLFLVHGVWIAKRKHHKSIVKPMEKHRFRSALVSHCNDTRCLKANRWKLWKSIGNICLSHCVTFHVDALRCNKNANAESLGKHWFNNGFAANFPPWHCVAIEEIKQHRNIRNPLVLQRFRMVPIHLRIGGPSENHSMQKTLGNQWFNQGFEHRISAVPRFASTLVAHWRKKMMQKALGNH